MCRRSHHHIPKCECINLATLEGNIRGGSRNLERGGGGGGGGGARVRGASPGRVQEGGTPPAQLGGMRERCKLPIGARGGAPEANAFCLVKGPKNTQKAGLLNCSYIVYTCAMHVFFRILVAATAKVPVIAFVPL